MMVHLDTSKYITLWKACYDQDKHDFYAIVLLPGLDREPVSFFPGATSSGKLVAKVQERYGPELYRVVPSRFKRAVQRRKTHQPRMLELLSQYHLLQGDDSRTHVIYGSLLHPLSARDIRPLALYGAIAIPADKDRDGYYTYIVAPQFLPEEQENEYELEFISRPLVMKGEE